MENLFGQIAGLPLHPLVIHFATVLIPLSAIGVIVVVLSKKLRRYYALPTLGMLLVSVPIAFIAKESGEQLAEEVGITADHLNYGTLLPPIVLGFFAVSVIWYLATRKESLKLMSNIFGVVAIAGAAVTLVFTFLVGHSGAEATWGDTFKSSDDSSIPTPSESEDDDDSGASQSPAPADGAITIDEVAKHDTAGDCWSVINGDVYDLTQFASQHPGGQAAINSLCGVDGTSAFLSQHGTQRDPNRELASLKIGTLAK
ncbi:MAG: cytochrome b5 domain-containing protein [Actinomycetota bacterium]